MSLSLSVGSRLGITAYLSQSFLLLYWLKHSWAWRFFCLVRRRAGAQRGGVIFSIRGSGSPLRLSLRFRPLLPFSIIVWKSVVSAAFVSPYGCFHLLPSCATLLPRIHDCLNPAWEDWKEVDIRLSRRKLATSEIRVYWQWWQLLFSFTICFTSRCDF